jgi:hypothetical protein
MPGWQWWWEEATELLTVAAVAVLLWEFRCTLGLARGQQGPRRQEPEPPAGLSAASTPSPRPES